MWLLKKKKVGIEIKSVISVTGIFLSQNHIFIIVQVQFFKCISQRALRQILSL